MYNEKIEALIVGALKYADQVRSEILKSKSLTKKYQWFLDELNVTVLKSNPAMREICERYVARQKLERAINMIRWFALYSLRGTGYVDKEAFLKYKKFIEAHIADEAKRYPPTLISKYQHVITAVDAHRQERVVKEN